MASKTVARIRACTFYNLNLNLVCQVKTVVLKSGIKYGRILENNYYLLLAIFLLIASDRRQLDVASLDYYYYYLFC